MEIQEKIQLAKKIVGKRPNIFQKTNFQKLYPFATENIAGYIDNFDLEGKSLLTVGSSADQTLNAALKGCKDITVLDVCPFTEEYYYLKKSALLKLSREEFFQFFSWVGRKRNIDAFSKKIWERIEETLFEENKESYQFWKELLEENSQLVRQRLFFSDEEGKEILEKINPYLATDTSYEKAKEQIKNTKVSFHTGDISTESFPNQYDVIFLSNIFDFIKKINAKAPIRNMLDSLKEDGIVLLYYMFECQNRKNPSEYLLDPSGVFPYFPSDYDYLFFPGLSDLERNNSMQDGAVVYQKKKH